MILEVARIQVRPGQEAAFEVGLAQALPLLRRARGCLSAEVCRSVERPGIYGLLVRWERLEDHTSGFQRSSAFTEWRRLIGSYFASTPDVEHWAAIEATAPSANPRV